MSMVTQQEAAELGWEPRWPGSRVHLITLCSTSAGGGGVKGAKNGTKSPMCLMCPSQALQSPPAGHLGDTLPHPTYLKTFLPGPCILSRRPPARVSPERCRRGAPGGCLPSTRPLAHTWGETGPVPQPLIRVFPGPLGPRSWSVGNSLPPWGISLLVSQGEWGDLTSSS